MRQKTTLEKFNNNEKIIDGNFKIIIKKIAHPFLLKLSKVKINYKIVRCNKMKKLEKHPIIFSVNHYSAQDTPIILNLIKKQAYILAGKQNLEPLDELFFNLNGTIFVDRKDKEDMLKSKEAMEQYLVKNQNIIMFPEGTWNLTDEQLILPMKWGIIDVAKKANAQIIPVALDYDRKSMECRAKFGEPILIPKGANKKEEINKLRDVMATLKLELIELKEPIDRATANTDELRKELHLVTSEYPRLNEEYEKSVIFKPYTCKEEVFAPIKRLELKKFNDFLAKR